jgi:hypothetical protein
MALTIAPAFQGTPAATDPFNPQPKKKRLSAALGGDPSFDGLDAAYGGSPAPSIDDTSAAYDTFLQSGEAARRREENAATDQVMEGLQGRGIAKSGIAIKDVISQVLGPSMERSSALAAQFGLEQAKNKSALDEAARGRAADTSNQILGGRLSSILQGQNITGQKDIATLNNEAEGGRLSQTLGSQKELQTQGEAASMAELLKNLEYGTTQADLQRAREAQTASENRRAGRQNALVGALGGAAGSVASSFIMCFSPETPIEMADGEQKRIEELWLGDETKGGRVESIRFSETQDLRDYKGVRVTGSHSVFEDGEWKRVRDSVHSPIIEGWHEVVSIIVSGHRVHSNGIVFDDELETAPLIPTNGTDKHIDHLNMTERAKMEAING